MQDLLFLLVLILYYTMVVFSSIFVGRILLIVAGSLVRVLWLVAGDCLLALRHCYYTMLSQPDHQLGTFAATAGSDGNLHYSSLFQRQGSPTAALAAPPDYLGMLDGRSSPPPSYWEPNVLPPPPPYATTGKHQ